MELYNKRRVVIVSLFVVAIVVLAAVLSIYFTAKPILYRNKGVLNGADSITSIEYSGSQMNAESSANYRFEFTISKYYLHVHIYKPDNSSSSHLLSAFRTAYLEYTGEISHIVLESDTYTVSFSFTLKKTNYEIDWIYGVITIAYVAFFIVMMAQLRKYQEGEATLENKLKSMQYQKPMQKYKKGIIKK